MANPEQRGAEILSSLVKDFYCESKSSNLVNCLEPNAIWVGSGEDHFADSYNKIAEIFDLVEKTKSIPKCTIQKETMQTRLLSPETLLVVGLFDMVMASTGVLNGFELKQRITCIFRFKDDDFKINHLHVSSPYETVRTTGIFPKNFTISNVESLFESLKIKEEQLSIVLNCIAGGLKGSNNDEHYSFSYVSDELCNMLGYTKDEFMEMSGGTVAGMIYQDDRERAFADAKACFEKGDSYSSEFRIRRKDGSLAWVLDTGRKVVNSDGIVNINSIIMDITGRREADNLILKQKDFLQSIYDNIQSGIVQCLIENNDLIVLNANNAALIIFGYGIEGFDYVINKSVFNFVYKDDIPFVTEQLEYLYTSDKAILYEHRCVCKDGSVIWVSISASILRNADGQEIFQGIFNDITAKKNEQIEADKEKDRYLFAMQNNSDIVFEYDLRRDIMRLHTVAPTDTGSEVLKQEIKNYKNQLEKHGMVHPYDREKLLNIICNGNVHPIEVRMRYPSDPRGVFRWVLLQGSIVKEDKEPAYCVGTSRDIARFKKAEEDNEMLQRQFGIAIRSSYDEVYEVNIVNDEIYYLHTTGGEFRRSKIETGYRQKFEQVLNSRIHPEDKSRYNSNYNPDIRLRDRKAVPDELYHEFRRKNANDQYHWYSYMTRKAGWDDYVLFIFIKNIDKIKAEEELHKQVLMDTLAAAERANNAKSDFLSRMSHDIRTPMNAIIGMTTIALASGKDREKVTDCLSKIGVSAKFLLSLINDVLDMSRIESGKMTIAKNEFNFKEFVNDISIMMHPQAKDKGIHLTINVEEPLDGYYIGDTLRLNQIMMNLMSNALKFTSKGGNIDLTIKQVAHSEKNATIRFVLADTGIGMDKIFFERIFLPFEQEQPDTTGQISGTGLGLSITKNLVHMMGGDITVDSARGKGTTFTVDIELGVSEKSSLLSNIPYEQYNIVAKAETEEFQGEKVLLVEDNDLNIEIAKTLLDFKGIKADMARNGEEAVNMFKSSPTGEYKAILMDIRMPVMDGLSAATAIRALSREDAKDVPIIAMTANAFREDMEKAKQCGMNAYIVKPIDTKNLYSVLHKAFYSKCIDEL